MTLMERQRTVGDVQLIPQVPCGVREIIRRAKKLYIYGFFEYSFFTVAEHYIYAAMEGGITSPVGVELGASSEADLSVDGTTREDAAMERPGYGAIDWYCETHGWKLGKLLVNGRPFHALQTCS